ncbi:MAG: flagellar basal body-associated FliL family protein [Clostridiales bacterium]|nr:flagellar basal body-associated FliL family protein [Clostridiales bacterium]
MIVIIALLIVILGGLAGLTIYTVGAFSGRESGAPPADKENIPVTTYDIKDSFKTNLLKGRDGKDHVISTDVSFTVSAADKKANEAIMGELAESDAAIKSAVLSVIRKCTAEDLSGADASETLSDKILAALRETFETDMITRVYIRSLYIG